MDLVYLGFVIFLFLLAISDLWVGVSNDAVNFLNSAVGSKAAKFRTIIMIAAAGVFCGAVMSNGMMDVARHGIFRPEQFAFSEIMLICLAVMVTDIVLLDAFNSLGMPTSTTVSLVFEHVESPAGYSRNIHLRGNSICCRSVCAMGCTSTIYVQLSKSFAKVENRTVRRHFRDSHNLFHAVQGVIVNVIHDKRGQGVA